MRVNTVKQIVYSLLLCILASTLVVSVQARQFRQVIPIATSNKSTLALPNGAVAVKKPSALGKEQIKTAVNEVISKWNTGDMEDSLSEEFFDKSRLGDAIDTIVPRDATLHVQSIQGVQTMQQYIVPGDEGDAMVSIVSATVRTQLEFNDPDTGFVSLPGLNEFVLKVTQPAPGGP